MLDSAERPGHLFKAHTGVHPAIRMTHRIPVTGDAGYICSHACKALARVGYWPVTYDSLVLGRALAVLE